MCVSEENFLDLVPAERPGDRLNVIALFVRFTRLPAHAQLPHALPLAYLDGPRVASFAYLRRVVPPERISGEAIYAVRERVSVTDGLRFVVYVAETRAIRGVFRKSEGQNWKAECARDVDCFGSVTEAEVCVAAEGHAAVTDRAVMGAVRETRVRRMGFVPMEAIPEECGSDGVDLDDWCDVDGDEVDSEGESWAEDVGLWVRCLGVGFMVSKSSAKTLRRLKSIVIPILPLHRGFRKCHFCCCSE